MKKHSLILLLSLAIGTSTLLSQQLTPSVISSSGGFYSNLSGTLSFTTGEMTAVETYSSPSAILTQGFQQNWDFGTYITEHPGIDFSFGIHPNPSDGNFYLVSESETAEHITVKILDLLGREILNTTYYHHEKTHVQSFDLSHHTQGIYMVVVTVLENTSNTENHFITKMSIVK